MALASIFAQSRIQYPSPVFTCCGLSYPTLNVHPHKLQFSTNRRVGSIALLASLLLATEAVSSEKVANGFEFRMTVPDQTVEQAESVIRDHAQALLDVKSLIELGSWKEAQREMRKYSSYLKQDIYTIIQSKQGSLRPLLRKLYSTLFNNVSKLDYAARDEDAGRVWESYNNVAAALNNILSRI